MNENTGQFRSAAFGGFHRQDVLDYLERITRENQTQKQALEQALAEEQAARAQAEARAQQAENKAAEAVADREAFEQTLAESRQAQEKITAALAEAEAQVAALREKVNDLEPGAESWRRIKDTAGDIEVSAHERAQRIIQSAQDQAAEIRAEGVRWILELQARCQRLKEDLHTSLFSAETELDSVRAAFSLVSSNSFRNLSASSAPSFCASSAASLAARSSESSSIRRFCSSSACWRICSRKSI